MADLEDKLNAILGNPEAMGQIMSIARSLSDTGDTAASDGQNDEQNNRAAEPPSHTAPDEDAGGQTPNSAAVAALLAGSDRPSPQAEDQSTGGTIPCPPWATWTPS